MRAIVYRGHKTVAVEDVPDPQVPGADGAIVRTTRFAICGSDLHGYHGPVDEERIGRTMGHECIGEVVEVGPEVKNFRSGDRVLVSAIGGCGRCAPCRGGLSARCVERASRVPRGPGLAAQAEAVGVEHADFELLAIPEGVSDEQAVLLTDILPTGYKGTRGAEIQPGETVAVVGAGPVGQMALETSFLFGPSKVFAIDRVPHRLVEAARLGAIPIDASKVDPHATLKIAFGALARGGILSQVGATREGELPVDPRELFRKDMTYKIGLVSPQFAWPELVPLVQQGTLHPERVITHQMAMSEGPAAYEVFAERADGVIKVLLDPGA